MDEIKSWRLAGEIVKKRDPSLLPKASSILAVSAMLAAGKIARLPKGERHRYRDCISRCRQAVKEGLETYLKECNRKNTYTAGAVQIPDYIFCGVRFCSSDSLYKIGE